MKIKERSMLGKNETEKDRQRQNSNISSKEKHYKWFPKMLSKNSYRSILQVYRLCEQSIVHSMYFWGKIKKGRQKNSPKRIEIF
jgi:hypothetical protein